MVFVDMIWSCTGWFPVATHSPPYFLLDVPPKLERFSKNFTYLSIN